MLPLKVVLLGLLGLGALTASTIAEPLVMSNGLVIESSLLDQLRQEQLMEKQNIYRQDLQSLLSQGVYQPMNDNIFSINSVDDELDLDVSDIYLPSNEFTINQRRGGVGRGGRGAGIGRGNVGRGGLGARGAARRSFGRTVGRRAGRNVGRGNLNRGRNFNNRGLGGGRNFNRGGFGRRGNFNRGVGRNFGGRGFNRGFNRNFNRGFNRWNRGGFGGGIGAGYYGGFTGIYPGGGGFVDETIAVTPIVGVAPTVLPVTGVVGGIDSGLIGDGSDTNVNINIDNLSTGDETFDGFGTMSIFDLDEIDDLDLDPEFY